jgi:NAD-dependent deacetylase
MTPLARRSQIEQAAELLHKARDPLVLTGAGLSTPSGIPDFRSPAAGLWEHADPFEVASLLTFRYHPQKFFNWLRPLATIIRRAQPNPAHYALAALEAARHVRWLVTQNIDGLHTRAGHQQVLELHGSMLTATCVRCHTSQPAREALDTFIHTGEMPRCAACGNLLKPDVILMGEQLALDVLRAARRAARDCDLIVVAGSSLEVMPAAGLPLEALDYGARLIIINYSPTYLDDRATCLIHADVAEALPQMATALGLNLYDSLV